MKKILLSILTVALATFSANAQNYYFQNFDDTTNLSGISIFDADQDGKNWGLYDMSTNATFTQLNGFNVVMGSQSWDTVALTPDNLLILGPVDLTSASNTLSLSWETSSATTPSQTWFAENYSVYTANGIAALATVATTTPINTTTLSAGGVTFANNTDLSSMTGMDSVFVVFRHHACTDQNVLFLDNISIDAGSSFVSIEEASDLDINIYTYNNELFVNGSDIMNNVTIKVINAIGQNVTTFFTNSNTNRFDISNLTSGVYLVNVTSNGVSKTSKVTVK